MLSGKTWRKDCKDDEESGWRITVFHKRSSLKELKHLPCKETRGQKFHYTSVSSDPCRSYEQHCVWQEISKGKWCWESTANSESGDFSSAAALGWYFSQVQWALCFQLGCGRCSLGLPWPVELWLLPAVESFIPGSCPNNDVQNNILPDLLPH